MRKLDLIHRAPLAGATDQSLGQWLRLAVAAVEFGRPLSIGEAQNALRITRTRDARRTMDRLVAETLVTRAHLPEDGEGQGARSSARSEPVERAAVRAAFQPNCLELLGSNPRKRRTRNVPQPCSYDDVLFISSSSKRRHALREEQEDLCRNTKGTWVPRQLVTSRFPDDLESLPAWEADWYAGKWEMLWSVFEEVERYPSLRRSARKGEEEYAVDMPGAFTVFGYLACKWDRIRSYSESNAHRHNHTPRYKATVSTWWRKMVNSLDSSGFTDKRCIDDLVDAALMCKRLNPEAYKSEVEKTRRRWNSASKQRLEAKRDGENLVSDEDVEAFQRIIFSPMEGDDDAG